MLVGAAMVALPFLDEPTAGDVRPRRRSLWFGRLLLGLAAALAWVMSALPGKYLPGGQATGVTILAGVLWLAVALILNRLARQPSRAPATLFGCVLVLGAVGYVAWEAFGTTGAWVGLALTGLCLAMIALRGRAGEAGAAVLFGAAMLTVIALGAELFAPHSTGEHAAALNGRVPLPRVHETAPVMVVGLALLLFLLVVLQLRIRHQDKLRAMGMRPAQGSAHAD
jgi:hypothetical protein